MMMMMMMMMMSDDDDDDGDLVERMMIHTYIHTCEVMTYATLPSATSPATL